MTPSRAHRNVFARQVVIGARSGSGATLPARLGPACGLVLWAALLFGVRFAAPPARVLTPPLSQAVAFAIDGQVFRAFGALELLALGAGCVVARRLYGGGRRMLTLPLLAATLVSLEAVWLRPLVDARTRLVLDGACLSPGGAEAVHQALYTACAAGQIGLLLAVAALLVWRSPRPIS